VLLSGDPGLQRRSGRSTREDAVRDLDTATKVITLSYSQDGVVHEAIDDWVAGTEEVISRSGVPLDINWKGSRISGTGRGSRGGIGRAANPSVMLGIRRCVRTKNVAAQRIRQAVVYR
jgi:hypothetical protein